MSSIKEIKRNYIRNFTTAKDFEEWLEKLHNNYGFALDINKFEHAEYCLNKLHDEFGTVDPEKLTKIIYE